MNRLLRDNKFSYRSEGNYYLLLTLLMFVVLFTIFGVTSVINHELSFTEENFGRCK